MDTTADQEPRRLDRRLLVGSAALALLLIAAGAWAVFDGRGENATPAEVGTSFLTAYGTFDADRAISYLADDADVSGMVSSVGARNVRGTLHEFRLLISLLEAAGYKQMLRSCEEEGSSAAGTTLLCRFDFHDLRSDEIGKGPFSGSTFDLSIRDGEVVRATTNWNIAEFSPQVWEPFARWVSTEFPKDAAVMYEDETYSGARLTEDSIRRWERYTREFARLRGGSTR